LRPEVIGLLHKRRRRRRRRRKRINITSVFYAEIITVVKGPDIRYTCILLKP
jgi:hypothetical protein